jgi:perosamine synthetase
MGRRKAYRANNSGAIAAAAGRGDLGLREQQRHFTLMQVLFRDINADADRFPPPQVPMLPVLSPAASVIPDLGKCHFFPSATAALTHAYRTLGIENGAGILLPAYHCGAMVEPALWLNAEVAFYRLSSDLHIDLEDAARRLGPNSNAMVIAHYLTNRLLFQSVTRL